MVQQTCRSSPFQFVSTTIFQLLLVISTLTSCVESDPYCDDTADVVLRVEIGTDKYPAETKWNVRDTVSGNVVHRGGPYEELLSLHNETYCVTASGCFEFTIFDSFKDGICCEGYQGNGYYKIFYDDDLIDAGGDFGYSKTSKKFGGGCPTSFLGELLNEDPKTCSWGASPDDIFLQYIGRGPHNCLLDECFGNCNSDVECAEGLFCYDANGENTVPGCKAVPFQGIKYCTSRQYQRPHTKSVPIPKSTPPVPAEKLVGEVTQQSPSSQTESQCPVGVHERSTTAPAAYGDKFRDEEDMILTTEVQLIICLVLLFLSLMMAVVMVVKLFMLTMETDYPI